MAGNGARRYWPWWWQVKEVVAVMIAVGVASEQVYSRVVRGADYDYVAAGIILACAGVVAFTEYAKSVLRRMNGNGNSR